MRGPLVGALILLVFVQLFGAAGDIRENWRAVSATTDIAALKSISSDLLSGLHKMVVERANVVNRLGRLEPLDPARHEELKAVRASADQIISLALDRLQNTSGCSGCDQAGQAARLAYETLTALRPEVDAAIQQPRSARPPGLLDSWLQTSREAGRRVIDLVAVLNRPAANLGGDSVAIEALISRSLLLRNEAGQDMLVLAQLNLRGLPLTQSEILALRLNWGRMELLAQNVEQLSELVDDSRVRTAFSAAREQYFGSFHQTREEFVATEPTLAPALSPDGQRIGVRGLTALTELSGTAVERSNEVIGEARKTALRNLILSILKHLFILTGMGTGIAVVHFWVLKPLGRLSRTMQELAAGDLVQPLPEYKRGGEIGDMTAAVAVFKQNALQLESDERERGRAEALLTSEREVLELTARRAPLPDVLSAICVAMETQMPGSRCTINRLSEDGLRLKVVAAPSMPPEYSEAVDCVQIGPDAGSCGTAIYRREPVICGDVETDPLWQRFRSLARSLGFGACWSVPLLSPQQEPLGSFAIHYAEPRHPDAREQDLTRRACHLAAIVIGNRRAEEELEQAKAAAELGNRTKSEFLANMSHELRTPLNAIIGFAEVLDSELRQQNSTVANAGYAGDIIASGRHLLTLINDILDVSKMEAGRVELRERICGVGDLINGCERIVRARAMERRLDLQLQIPPGLPPVLVDDVKIKQIILNLLSNAIKFTAPGGSVALRVQADFGRGLAISVIDSGIGIKPDDVEKVFVPFHQVDNIYARINPGTGLGLALSKGLAELHGGRLVIESVFGKGTTVTLIIPPSRILISDLVDSRIS
jgi:two-component system, cell cycle sensor histidine kinase PleC